MIEAGREFKVLAENTLDEGFMASPAVAGRALFLRTKTHLYRIEQAPTTPSRSCHEVTRRPKPAFSAREGARLKAQGIDYGSVMRCCSNVPPMARWKSAIA